MGGWDANLCDRLVCHLQHCITCPLKLVLYTKLRACAAKSKLLPIPLQLVADSAHVLGPDYPSLTTRNAALHRKRACMQASNIQL